MTTNGTAYYYQLNGHGDVVKLTDASGNVVAQYQYDAWGNIISQSGTMASANPYRYAGYRFDDATQLYYLMVRYYNPEIGRFITKDTFHGFESDPKSLNLYAYAENNPIRYIDPTGHSITDLAKKAGYNAFFWAIKSLYEGIVLYFWNRPSGLDWGLWAMKTVITGQAAIISSQFGPWTAGIITTAALIGSDLLARTVKSYANYIKNRSANRSTIAYWAARDVTNYLFF